MTRAFVPPARATALQGALCTAGFLDYFQKHKAGGDHAWITCTVFSHGCDQGKAPVERKKHIQHEGGWAFI